MNKILIGIGVILSAYLIYTAVSNDEDTSPVLSEKTKETRDIVEEPEIAAYVNTDKYLDDSYSLVLETKLATTNQTYTFNRDMTFELRRYVVEPKNDPRDSTTSGTYSIDKNTVALTFKLQRDLEIFPEDVIMLKIIRNGNLKYGNFELIKD
jgi:hypothetical protein